MLSVSRKEGEMNLLFDKDAEGSIQDTVKMCTWELLEGKILLELPEGMEKMPAERQEKYYPYEGRPEIILEHMECDVQITFQMLEKKLKPEEVYKAVHEIYKLIDKAFPKYKKTKIYLADDGEVEIGWFLMEMEDGGKEHMKAVFSAMEKIALLTVTYKETEKWKWRVLGRDILASMRLEPAYENNSKGGILWNR